MLIDKEWREMVESATPDLCCLYDMIDFDNETLPKWIHKKSDYPEIGNLITLTEYIEKYWPILKDTEYAPKLMAMIIGSNLKG